MRDRPAGKTRYRSLEELADSPEFRKFAEAEFPNEAPKLETRTSRRRFLKLMGASVALAGLTGCRWPEEEIVPFAGRPDGVTPGIPRYFATSKEIGGVSTGLLARSYDGRPIKIEGNPLHPGSLGGSDHFAQASVLELYDPDRSTAPVESVGGKSIARDWADFEAFAGPRFAKIRESGGKGLRILSEATSSPTLRRKLGDFLKAHPQARWCEHEPFGFENEREGHRFVGGDDRVVPRLDRAELVICLDADPLGTHPAAVRNARDFSRGRTGENGHMSRLVVIESGPTLTGGMADDRYPIPTHEIPVLAAKLVAELRLDLGRHESVRSTLERARAMGETPSFVRDLAREIEAAEPWKVVLLVGPRMPRAVHALAEAVNNALESKGRDVVHAMASGPELMPIPELAAELSRGEVDTLLILGGNPAFDAPADLGLASGIGKACTSIHLGLHRNETARSCSWHLPRAHALESWGDGRAWDQTVTMQQPLIAPLYDGRTPLELIAFLADGKVQKGHDLLRPGFDDEATFRIALHDGVKDTCLFRGGAETTRSSDEWSTLFRPVLDPARVTGSLEIVFMRDYRLHDGRFANNGWLQEMPDPITKLTWGNAALMGPATAEARGVESGDVVKISRAGGLVELPVMVVPGIAKGTVVLECGHGRTAAGRIGDGVGGNVYPLRTTDALYVALDATIEPTGRTEKLATTQDHGAIDMPAVWGKEKIQPRVYREATLEHFLEEPHFVDHVVRSPPLKSLWDEPSDDETGYRWGMAVDLSKCTGCSACLVACTAENNVPVVGKDEVLVGRVMHWLRLDRSFSGDPENPDVGHQPVACQHCEHAPCEEVCPVAATVHSDEGLNDMVYNRCVGTRYCSNNCPYKVRRFNWFLNHRDATAIQKMVFNPEVTVRSRGVMEKCTFCVQRIQAAKIAAKREGLTVRDGEVVPACAQACPADAITFGDLNDHESRVRKDHENPRAYGMLAELNVRPRTAYLAKLRNPGESTDSK